MMTNNNNEEDSYVYCAYSGEESYTEDDIISELRGRILILQRERDNYKQKAELYARQLEKKKKLTKKPCQLIGNSGSSSNSVISSKWISMTGKHDWFSK